MFISSSAIVVVWLLLLIAARETISTPTGRGSQDCRCMPNDPCWPSSREWNAFNRTVNGHLVRFRPVGSVCHGRDYNPAGCAFARNSTHDSLWRIAEAGALQSVTWETQRYDNGSCFVDTPRPTSCSQGRIPLYGILAHSAQDIQKAVRFARQHNLHVAIRNTGHDGIGRSSGLGSFQINVSLLKKMDFASDFIPQGGGTSRGSALTLGAGVLGLEALAAGKKEGVNMVTGTCSSVAASGGFVQGGGLGFLGPAYGIGSDNVLEFEVVTAEGDLVVANEYQNEDLFWALRGGGGGTFGVVVRTTIRTYPDVPAVHFLLTANLPRQQNGTTGSGDQAIWAITAELTNLLPALKRLDNKTSAIIVPRFLEDRAVLEAHVLFVNTSDTGPIEQRLDMMHDALEAQGLSSAYTSELTVYPEMSAWLNIPRQLNGGGYGLVEGSVLISEDLFFSPNGTSHIMNVLSHLEYIVGDSVEILMSVGGQVKANKDVIESALLPGWREAELLLTIRRTLPPTSLTKTMVNSQLPFVRALQVPSLGVYYNVVDIEQPDSRRAFWGDNYERLYAVKQRWDPDGLFIVRMGVGSEDWDEEGICRV
ncbi:FAD-binding domain-containing protein [Aspergillus brunneoviolaceus CBS 621.78]|uniref:FAD-binding domain-containing protein n=1 Tax=Aspergillus brunneoviolaceus CBS 621.78 TaxID=1450534 RepID=A0ACD1GPY2_9EURO|nr:FAD-binding domain-containing protein [Aspergillus brunneoviolaceus CBS 621.78]RAH51121.1 FAD-binding domain-containing protein [Aspergillus brunneoviolaceus CBS 621.78]